MAVPKPPPQCGTYAGYQAHLRRGETTCGPCRKAAAGYSASLRAASPARRAKDRWWKKTRQKALERLAAEHPARFLHLIDEERAEGDSAPVQAARREVLRRERADIGGRQGAASCTP
jgi:hypothetical protein